MAGQFSQVPIPTNVIGSSSLIAQSPLVPFNYNSVTQTYISSGTASGQISTAVFKTNGSSGSIVATLTFSYNSDGRLFNTERT